MDHPVSYVPPPANHTARSGAATGLRAVLLALTASPALAQLGLPPVGVPSLPIGQGTLDEVRRLGELNGSLHPQALLEAQRERWRKLVRLHRDVLEADPKGQPAVRGEVAAVFSTAAAAETAMANGFRVAREIPLAGTNDRIQVLLAPAERSTQRALQDLKAIDPAGIFDYNHLYFTSGDAPEPLQSAAPPPAGRTAAIRAVRVGLIDGGIDTAHPAIHDLVVHEHGCGGKSVNDPHGTAVASLLAGSSAKFHGAAPGAELYAANVYCGLPTGGAADAVAEAFYWLARERVPVINVSLVGPRNSMLELMVRLMLEGGQIIVAAVGNDGPAASPLYPASYPGVVGVTAVDARRQPLPEAARGPQVMFAAPGADIEAAQSPDRYARVRGTSFAAPLVAGLLAVELGTPDKDQAQRAIAMLARRAVDLGAPGPDRTYGNGLVAEEFQPRTANTGRRPD